VLEAGVLALGVLSNDDDVDVLVARGEAREVEAVDKRGVEVELLPELHVKRAHAAAHGRDQPALQAHLVLLDRLHHLLGDPLHVPAHLVPLEVHRRVHRLHHLLHRTGHQWSDPISRDQCHGAWSAVSRPGHVRHGPGWVEARGGAWRFREELFQNGYGFSRHRGGIGSGRVLGFCGGRGLRKKNEAEEEREEGEDGGGRNTQILRVGISLVVSGFNC
jgi:hypothetical protein